MGSQEVFAGKKIFIVSDNEELIQRLQDILKPHGGHLFIARNPKDAIGGALAKKPDLLIHDDRFPQWNGASVLAAIRKVRPKGRVLLIVPGGTPLRSIDVTAQGASFTINIDSNPQSIYNAVKHSLSISSVPRYETAAG